jgi:hypothetical protein
LHKTRGSASFVLLLPLPLLLLQARLFWHTMLMLGINDSALSAGCSD